jgi:hypothetical protein
MRIPGKSRFLAKVPAPRRRVPAFQKCTLQAGTRTLTDRECSRAHPRRRETDHQLLSGCREDVLRKVNGAWKVRRRTIVLDANVLLDKNLSVFL